MQKKPSFLFKRLKEKLWFRPTFSAIISVGAALLAHVADNYNFGSWLPSIEKDSLSDLLETLANSMLVIAIFAVASMLSAFSAASGTATPRSFKLIASDDLSQNALSVFIGSFIFSIVAGVSLKNGFFGNAGLFTLFVLTIFVFALVILTFLRWVERISKLGRLDHTIQKVEIATLQAFMNRYCHPLLGGSAITKHCRLQEVYSKKVGYVQTINMEALQKTAKKRNITVVLNCQPGTYATPGRALAFVTSTGAIEEEIDAICEAVTIGRTRLYDEDPRFGLIALSEIGSRALSPGINDPGTAIAILGSQVRIFSEVTTVSPEKIVTEVTYPNVQVPPLVMDDLFEDAFRSIARDGAGNIEVMTRMQKAFRSLAALPNRDVQRLAVNYSQSGYERAAKEIEFENDLALLRTLRL